MQESLANTLLAAQVDYVIRELTSSRLQTVMESRLDQTLELAATLRLNDVVSSDMIKQVARRYACEVELSMAVPEIAAAVGRALHTHPVHKRTTLANLMPDRHFQQITEKALELREVRSAFLDELLNNPSYAALLADGLMQALKQHVAGGTDIASIPGLRRLMSFSLQRAGKPVPSLSVLLEETIRDFIGQSVSTLLRESAPLLTKLAESEVLRETILDVWQQLRNRTTDSFLKSVSALDVEEFFVILYDYWHSLRKTEIYGAFIDTGIDAFFAKYGAVSLTDLLEELGITRELMLADAMLFAPHVIGVLEQNNMLEILLRQQLAGFYESGCAERVIAKHLANAAGIPDLPEGKP
ncbi:Conserved hypothetical protein [gamma proteobacterium HdN1]|nr:Conserved hypothetical protein [gamma proteobacterium HdN1]